MYSILPREYPSDRPMYSHNDMLKILQVKAKAVIKLLEETKPDYVFLSFIGAMSSMLYITLQENGYKNHSYLPSRNQNLLSLTEDYNKLTFSEETFQKLKMANTKASVLKRQRSLLRNSEKDPQHITR